MSLQRQPPKIFLFLLSLLYAFVIWTACDRDGPTEPQTELDVTFSGTFTPSSVATNGVCTLELEAKPTGGEPPYQCTWTMSWINQASSARGYPNECTVNVSLPDNFGPGLYSIDLSVRDRRDRDDEVARAGTDEAFDCTASSQTTFFGS